MAGSPAPAPTLGAAPFAPGSARWERARVAAAYEEATERLWAVITEVCQRSLKGPERIEAALEAVLRMFEREPATACLLVLTGPASPDANLREMRLLLEEHLAALLHSAAPRGRSEREGSERAQEAIERAFAITGAALSTEGVIGVRGLGRELSRVLVGGGG